MVKIVRTDRELECPIIDKELRESGAELLLIDDGASEDELAHHVRDADLLLTCYAAITDRVLAGAERLKGIVKYGVGIDAIDTEAAKERRIPVVNIPDYAEETVAEGAFALMIALAKKLPMIDRAMHETGWIWPSAAWRGSDIAGKTIGLIGAGRIGRSFARMAGAGFRAHIIGYDPYRTREEMHGDGIEKIDDLMDLLRASDFVSIHSVLTPQTRGMIGESAFKAMKPTAFLINVSRGAIVDEDALLRALEDEQIAGAGLDTFSQEPLSLTGHPLSRLFQMDNVILFPHLTFFTDEAMARLEEETLERCREILAGQPVLVRSSDPRLISQQHRVLFPPD